MTRYASRRNITYSRCGLVATSSHLAAGVGAAVLRNGGNAVDAALAAAAALTVVEPTSNGLGGDLFALIWHRGKIYGLNASGPAPQGLTADFLRSQGHRTMPQRGALTITVPGVTAGWAELNRRFGSRSLAETIEPAARLAEEGYLVGPTVSALWKGAHAQFKDEYSLSWRQTFGSWRADEGDCILLPRLAATLRRIGESGGEFLYREEGASKLATFVQSRGGVLSAKDLADFRPQWVEPIHAPYGPFEVYELPPNGHGAVVLAALRTLAQLPETDDTRLREHRKIEALKLAMTDGFTHIADPRSMTCKGQDLFDETYAAARARLIGPQARRPVPGEPPRGGTVYLCAADRAGTMVSLIQSNYCGFGSGLVEPDLWVALHNRGANFTLLPGHPNEPAPGKRPYHTIIPAFLTRDGEPYAALGVMGGFMQPQGHLQVITSLSEGLSLQQALDKPRWRWEGDLNVSIEAEVDPELKADLEARGHRVTVDESPLDFGRGQIIARIAMGYAGATEPRCDGAVIAP